MPTVRALAERALALDETWSKGALHEMFISLDSLPEALGGIAGRARATLHARGRAAEGARRRVPTSRSPSASPCRRRIAPSSRRCSSRRSAIDPEKDPSDPLVTLVQQRRARALLDQIDTMFTK